MTITVEAINCTSDPTNRPDGLSVDTPVWTKADLAILDNPNLLREFTGLPHDLGAMALQNAGDTSGQAGRDQPGDGETTPYDAPLPPDVRYDDGRIPPSWRNEHAEGQRRIILVGDAHNYFLHKQREPLPEGMTYENDVWLERVAERKIGGDQGEKVGVLLNEILSNYTKFCTRDIKSKKDTGHRTIIVSVDEAGIAYIDYYDDDKVSRLTFNTFAVTFGQNAEPPTDAERSADPACEQLEFEELEKRNVMKVAEANRDELRMMAAFGAAYAAGAMESGRALPYMRLFAPADRPPSIKRYGTFPGRENQGAHLQLVVDIDREESIREIDLDDFPDD